MCSIKQIIYLLLALHGVRCKEGAILDYVEGRNDPPLTKTTTDAATTFKDQSEPALGSNTETIKESTIDMITTAKTRFEIGEAEFEESTERAEFTEPDVKIYVNGNDSNSFESTARPKTTTDHTTALIDVEKLKAKQSTLDDDSDHDMQISDSFRKLSTQNESLEAPADSHESDLSDDDIIKIKIAAPHKNVTKEKTIGDDIEESVKTNSKNELVLEDTFQTDTADLLNSSLLTRRMLGGYGMDFKLKSSGDSAYAPKNLIDKESDEIQDQHLSLAPTTFTSASTTTSTLPLLLETSLRRSHINPRLDKSHDETTSTIVPEVLLPLFRSLRPTNPTLIQQIQPYLQALASTRQPMYNQYQANASPIFQRLQQVTQELRIKAQQYVDLYRNQWNPLLNNVYNNHRY